MAETVLDSLSATNGRISVDEFSRISIRCDDLRALLAVARAAEEMILRDRHWLDKQAERNRHLRDALAPLLRPADPPR
jgi:hypothetical protein